MSLKNSPRFSYYVRNESAEEFSQQSAAKLKRKLLAGNIFLISIRFLVLFTIIPSQKYRNFYINNS